MAVSQQDVIDLYPSEYDPNLYLYDPDPRARYRRRRRSRSAMPRRRRSRRATYDPQFRRFLSRHRPTRKTPKNWMNRLLSKKAGPLWGVVAGLWAINQNTGYQPGWGNVPLSQKLQAAFLGIPLYRLTGNQSGMPQGWNLPPRSGSFSISKGLNTATYVGLAAFIYGILPFKLPHQAQARNIGLPIALGGFIGGGFDPTPGSGGAGKVVGPQITRPTQTGIGARATYAVGNAPVPTSFTSGLQA